MCTKRRSNIDNKELQEKVEASNTEKKVIICGHCNLQGHIKQEFDCYGINRFICEYCGSTW